MEQHPRRQVLDAQPERPLREPERPQPVLCSKQARVPQRPTPRLVHRAEA